MIITIDGPAGSGKSTTARELARAMGIAYLDTGATYRAVTLKAMREEADMEDGSALAELAAKMDLELLPGCAGLQVRLDGQDASEQIRSVEVSENTHYAARSPEVREVLVDLQRRLGAELGDFVSEGRDQGSVVFPQAEVKFFLEASPQIRARRRSDQLIARGESADYEWIFQAICRRDSRDRGRKTAPLIRPDDAIEIDTSEMTIEQVVAELLRCVEAAR